MPVPTALMPRLHWDRDDRTGDTTFTITVSRYDIERARRESPVARLMMDASDQIGATVSDKLRALAEVVFYKETAP